MNKPNDETIDSTCYTFRKAAKEELQCQPADKELIEEEVVQNITTDLKLKETWVATKWKDKMIVRYITSTENHLNIRMIPTTSTPKMSDYG